MVSQPVGAGLDPGLVSDLGQYGPDVVDLAVQLVQKGFTQDWIRTAVTRLGPLFLKLATLLLKIPMSAEAGRDPAECAKERDRQFAEQAIQMLQNECR
jgi:hypothetical protein